MQCRHNCYQSHLNTLQSSIQTQSPLITDEDTRDEIARYYPKWWMINRSVLGGGEVGIHLYYTDKCFTHCIMMNCLWGFLSQCLSFSQSLIALPKLTEETASWSWFSYISVNLLKSAEGVTLFFTLEQVRSESVLKILLRWEPLDWSKKKRRTWYSSNRDFLKQRMKWGNDIIHRTRLGIVSSQQNFPMLVPSHSPPKSRSCLCVWGLGMEMVGKRGS